MIFAEAVYQPESDRIALLLDGRRLYSITPDEATQLIAAVQAAPAADEKEKQT